MARLPRTWWAGWPERVVVVGFVVALTGIVVELSWAAWSAPLLVPLPMVGVRALQIGLSIIGLGLLARRRARTSLHFAILGVLASAVALLGIGGLPGGLVALAGAILGIFATYEGVADAPRR